MKKTIKFNESSWPMLVKHIVIVNFQIFLLADTVDGTSILRVMNSSDAPELKDSNFYISGNCGLIIKQ